jgi:hypothetical protein
MTIDYRGFIEKYFTITTIAGETVPFRFNDIQNHYYDLLVAEYGEELANIRENILKSRRFGFSSIIDAMFCVDFVRGEMGWAPLTSSTVYSYKQGDTNTLFKRVNQFIDSWLLMTQGKSYLDIENRNSPLLKKLRKEFLEKDQEGTGIYGAKGSDYECLTAGAKTSGRGGTKQNLHWSEVAFYNNTAILDAKFLVIGAEEQVSSGVGKIFRETTGNVADNFFAEEYAAGKEGKSQFRSRFLPWHMFNDYRQEAPADWAVPEYYRQIEGVSKEQAYWHFMKTNGLSDKVRMREYPTTDTEAFLLGGDPYFSGEALVWYSGNVQGAIRECEFVGGLI